MFSGFASGSNFILTFFYAFRREQLAVLHYVVRISLKAVSASRERAKVKEYKKENTSKRSGIEGSNSALKRKGLEKLQVRGKTKSSVGFMRFSRFS